MSNAILRWIVSRYGPVTLTGTGTGIVAKVPVMGGTCIGIGYSIEIALRELLADLTVNTDDLLTALFEGTDGSEWPGVRVPEADRGKA